MHRNIHVLMHGSDDPLSFLPICYSWYFGTVVMVGSWPRKVLPTFAFVAKPYALLWATVLFMHCSCMLIDLFGYLAILLVLSLAPRGFSPGTPVFPSPQKPTFPNSNQVDEEPFCGCATCKSLIILFIYLFN